MQRVLLIPAEFAVPDWLSGSHPDIVTGILANPTHSDAITGPLPSMQDDIVVVDPLGNLVIRYPSDVAMRDLRTDLSRLLKLSRIG